MRKPAARFFTAFMLLLASSLASAGDGKKLTISDNGKKTTFACTADTDVDVLGNENKLTLTGVCRNVTVSGNWNTVNVDGAAEINVLGNHNAVSWKRGAKDDPKVRNPGNENKVEKVK